MPTDEASSLRTRPSLLNRLKQSEDSESWQEFYRVYGKVVRDFALHAGLSDSEADEVVQETAIAMARHLPTYTYNPRACRFKTWLLNQASWRIKDQLKKRHHNPAWTPSGRDVEPQASAADHTARTATINRVPDANAPNLDALFEERWRSTLLTMALERVKQKFSLKHFQAFDLLVLKQWPASEVARSLGLTLANVYVIRHRISAAIKKDIKQLDRELEDQARCRSATLESSHEVPDH